MRNVSRRQSILDTVSDLVRDLLYYGRKDDEELKVGDIDEAVRNGEISVDEIVAYFRAELVHGLQDEP